MHPARLRPRLALSKLTLNRFLYAAADPETLIDPSGHTVLLVDDAYGTTITTDSTHKHVVHHQFSAAQVQAYAKAEAAYKARAAALERFLKRVG
ncbi:MAG TPA: hypothetical protein VIM83_02595, partial [Candidatus Limnocylindria bacterium]